MKRKRFYVRACAVVVTLLIGFPSVTPDGIGGGLGSLCLEVSEAAAADKVWDGDDGNGLWFTGTNWYPDGIPLENQTVLHDLPGTITYKQQAGDQNPMILTFEGAPTAPDTGTLIIDTESTLTVKDFMSLSVLGTGSYTINIAGGTSTTDDGGIVFVGESGETTALTQRFTWMVNNNSETAAGADDAMVFVRGTIGQGPWTVKGRVEAITINSTSLWSITDGGFVVADDFFDLTGWTIGNGTTSGTVQVDNFMRIVSGAVNPKGSILAGDGGTDQIPRIDVTGLVEVVGGAGNDGTISVDRLNVPGGGELRLRNGDTQVPDNLQLQVEVFERYFRVSGTGKLTYGNGTNFAEIVQNASTSGVNLLFGGASSLLTRATGTTGTLFLWVACSVDIYTVVTGHVGRGWNSTGVDLKINPDGIGSPDLEVTSPDDCNIMFVDSSGNLFPPNPCIKYWRSLEINRTDAELVDVRDNYVNGIATDEAAIYLVNDINHHGGSAFTFDLNGNVIYYGGSDLSDATFIDGRRTQLIKTTYGDFDGDCDIDAADQAQFDGVYSGSNSVTCFPLADADGDCDVDAADEAVFDANKAVGGNDRCLCAPNDYCTFAELQLLYPGTGLDPSCPDVPSCLAP